MNESAVAQLTATIQAEAIAEGEDVEGVDAEGFAFNLTSEIPEDLSDDLKDFKNKTHILRYE